MAKRAISVTLETDNLTWLRGRVRAAGRRSVSELLDQLVSDARKGRSTVPSRSVVGMVTVDPTDAMLDRADQAVRELFAASLARPLGVNQRRASYRARASRRRRRG